MLKVSLLGRIVESTASTLGHSKHRDWGQLGAILETHMLTSTGTPLERAGAARSSGDSRAFKHYLLTGSRTSGEGQEPVVENAECEDYRGKGRGRSSWREP